MSATSCRTSTSSPTRRGRCRPRSPPCARRPAVRSPPASWRCGSSAPRAPTPSSRWSPTSPSCRRCRCCATRRPAERPVTFGYHGRPATSIRTGCCCATGSGTCIGRDHEADEQRTYRVDRIEGDVTITGADHAFERPDGFDPRDQFPTDAKRVGVGDAVVVDAVVRVSAERAVIVEREVGTEHVVRRYADGAIDRRGAVRQRRRVRVVGARPHRPRRGARPAGGEGGGDRAAHGARRRTAVRPR